MPKIEPITGHYVYLTLAVICPQEASRRAQPDYTRSC